jgi:hypothetical protein
MTLPDRPPILEGANRTLGKAQMLTFKFKGSSNTEYLYSMTRISEVTNLPVQPGNYILVSGNATNPTPILITCAQNIREQAKSDSAAALWDVAKNTHRVTLLYFHIDSNRDVVARQAEWEDLYLFYKPPMNIYTSGLR